MSAQAEPAGGEPAAVPRHKAPLYPQLLGLKHVHPNAWQRAALGEGMIILGGLLALADVASAWSAVVLPVAVGVVVKAHDVLAGLLAPDAGASADLAVTAAHESGRDA